MIVNNLVPVKEPPRPRTNIIPRNQMIPGNRRTLRSHRLSPNQFNKFGKVRKRIDAPHYKKEFGQLHPYVDKNISVTVLEDKPPLEKIKEQFHKEVYGKK